MWRHIHSEHPQNNSASVNPWFLSSRVAAMFVISMYLRLFPDPYSRMILILSDLPKRPKRITITSLSLGLIGRFLVEMLLTYDMLPVCRPPCADLANESVPLFIRALSCLSLSPCEIRKQLNHVGNILWSYRHIMVVLYRCLFRYNWLTLEHIVIDEYDVSVRQLRTLFTY